MAIASPRRWKALIVTVIGLMAAMMAAPRFLPQPDLRENRELASRPPWPKRASEASDFRKGVDAWVSDRFPPRAIFISLLNRARMALGVSGSSRVIVGRDGWLFYDDGSHMGAARGDPPMSPSDEARWLSVLAGRTQAMAAEGRAYVVLLAPMKEAIYPQQGPWWFRVSPDRAAVRLAQLAAQSGLGEVVYPATEIEAAAKAGQVVYSRHDTHWTGYGAYQGYAALMRRLQARGLVREGPAPLSAFVRSGFADPSVRDLAMMLGVGAMVDVNYPHLRSTAPGPNLTTTWLGRREDWTAEHVVDTGMAGKPVLLMTMDSFSNELAPFLYPHFSRLILAHNQDGAWRPDLIDRFSPDIVLMQVIERGAGPMMAKGPQPSEDAVLAAIQATGGPAPMDKPSAALAAALDAAETVGGCNLEKAVVDGSGQMLDVAGWISELARANTAPEGYVRLVGPGGDRIAPIRVDGARPDVSDYTKISAAADSGFEGMFSIQDLAPGDYAAAVYRRLPAGWMACRGAEPLRIVANARAAR